ncbi:RIB43A-like with coiled-coils protein 2 [Corythoichthys intestinalis]|uniref:RIB43A-like with coiled-coils protein 2 n=1 Tax=Corythoichthys intestinalis TaxID=161448 RepID=UPI0025A5F321|nr:RIB43A-like with coiled-coils protein 2 [Corythoichthys intestinalis]XP_061812939.1 RIB43A-like with coiled-coils protein 2 [Nerophis lumbriciformis]
MMMNNTELLSDVKVRMRRDNEARRRARLLDDKQRSIGIDKEFLDKQVAEKIARKQAEKEEQKAYDAAMMENIYQAPLLHNRQVKVTRGSEKATVDFYPHHQQPRGFPTDQGHLTMLPGLHGEDPDRGSRVQRQKEQLRRWLIQQRDEQAAEKHRKKMEKLQDDRQRVHMDNEAVQLHNKDLERRKAAAVVTKEWNVNTMTKTEEKRRQVRNEELIQQQGQHAGSMGAPGLCPSSDRKPPPESLMQITVFHKNQIEEKLLAELKKRGEERQNDGIRLDSARMAVLLERQQARNRKQFRRRVDTVNKQLAAAHQNRKEDLRHGHIDESFFSQFNTSCR